MCHDSLAFPFVVFFSVVVSPSFPHSFVALVESLFVFAGTAIPFSPPFRTPLSPPHLAVPVRIFRVLCLFLLLSYYGAIYLFSTILRRVLWAAHIRPLLRLHRIMM